MEWFEKAVSLVLKIQLVFLRQRSSAIHGVGSGHLGGSLARCRPLFGQPAEGGFIFLLFILES